LHFGATLRLLRVDAGLSLRQLAEQIGVSSAYLSRVENGVDPVPTPDRLVAIARTVGVPAPLLLDAARQALPAASQYLEREPSAGALLLDIARRRLSAGQIARIHAFIDREFPGSEGEGPEARLSELLLPSRVVLGLSGSDLGDVIDVACLRLPRKSGGTPRELAERVRSRELESATALGNGFAVPHAIVEGATPSAALVTLARPLAMKTPDARPLRVAVVLITGAADRAHLTLLAQVARLASYNVAQDLCAAQSAARALTLVEQYEHWVPAV
jgi:PTS system nitrogen regulatory IIA component